MATATSAPTEESTSGLREREEEHLDSGEETASALIKS
jgi:hypothetical protein